MVIWVLYFSISGQLLLDYPFYFHIKEDCEKKALEVTPYYQDFSGHKCIKDNLTEPHEEF